MQSYIVLLRGVNVSGHNIIKMQTLRDVLKNAGFDSVETYIQSGNILLSSSLSSKHLEEKIQSLLHSAFDILIDCFAFTYPHWMQIIQNMPFLAENVDMGKIYCCHYKGKINANQLKTLKEKLTDNELLMPGNNCLYIYYAQGAGNTKLTNNAIEKISGIRATTRNWRTTLKLLDMISAG